MPTSVTRRVLGALATLLLTGLVVSGSAGTAHAADGYTYWNYYHAQDGTWAFSKVGPGDFDPKDGAIEAYRYGTSTTKDTITPRVDLEDLTFEDICGDAEATDGEKRVGVLLDPGIEADADSGETPPAPRGACAVVPEDANGQQVLDAVSDVRLDQALICGIDGYPVKSCTVTVKNAQVPEQGNVAFDLPNSADSGDAAVGSTDTGLLWPLIGVGLVVVLIGSSALAMNRRKKSV